MKSRRWLLPMHAGVGARWRCAGLPTPSLASRASPRCAVRTFGPQHTGGLERALGTAQAGGGFWPRPSCGAGCPSASAATFGERHECCRTKARAAPDQAISGAARPKKPAATSGERHERPLAFALSPGLAPGEHRASPGRWRSRGGWPGGIVAIRHGAGERLLRCRRDNDAVGPGARIWKSQEASVEPPGGLPGLRQRPSSASEGCATVNKPCATANNPCATNSKACRTPCKAKNRLDSACPPRRNA